MQQGQPQKELEQIIAKIRESDSVLIALSQNPSVDELSTAMGLALFIDKLGKHATAIYSGQTPNVLAFLNPEQKFETNTNGLQDFIIAINKDKADHLRYKLDGDYVKVYITPYRTTISESDLEFSHGDYNVNLVIALNVENAEDLDAALSEHGRIMHDAAIVNIAAGAPGKFGEVQWVDPGASSVAEMATELVFAMKDDAGVDKEIATALLTGVVAATERFSNNRTQPDTMNVAAKLMEAGADQQLISANIMKEEPRALEIERGEAKAPEAVQKEEPELPSDSTVLEVRSAETKEEPVAQVEEQKPEEVAKSPVDEVLESLKTKEEGVTIPAVEPQPEMTEKTDTLPEVQIPEAPVQQPEMPVEQPKAQLPEIKPLAQNIETSAGEIPKLNSDVMAELKKMSEPKVEEEEKPALDTAGALGKDYGSMIDEALSEGEQPKAGNGYLGGNPALMAAPKVGDDFEDKNIPELSFDRPVDMSEEKGDEAKEADSYIAPTPMKTLEPVDQDMGAVVAPEKTLEPKPEGLPLPDEDILPPPPTPPIDFSDAQLPTVDDFGGQEKTEEVAAAPQIESAPIAPLGEPQQPAAGAEVPGDDAGAFKIPGM